MAALALASGCSAGPVEVDPPQPTGDAARACTRLIRSLPQELDGERQRDTKPASEYTAAWGDPPVVLRCGVPRPAGLQPTSTLFSVNRVDWFPVEHDDGSATFTTTDRVADVELAVPEDQQPGANYLVDLAVPLDDTVPEKSGPVSGKDPRRAGQGAGRTRGTRASAGRSSGAARHRADGSPGLGSPRLRPPTSAGTSTRA
ncbi:MAG: DUF3515 domain-containing protein [Actinomycetes bacterium]